MVLPTGFSGSFTVNPATPATPPEKSLAQVSIDASAAAGDFTFDVMGTATDADDRSVTINVTVYDAVPGAPGLLAPADGATGPFPDADFQLVECCSERQLRAGDR